MRVHAQFASKRELDRDYVVPPLEGLWWTDDVETITRRRDKSQWSWTLLLLVPDWLDASHVGAAIEQVAVSKAGARLDDVRFETPTTGSTSATSAGSRPRSCTRSCASPWRPRSAAA